VTVNIVKNFDRDQSNMIKTGENCQNFVIGPYLINCKKGQKQTRQPLKRSK